MSSYFGGHIWNQAQGTEGSELPALPLLVTINIRSALPRGGVIPGGGPGSGEGTENVSTSPSFVSVGSQSAGRRSSFWIAHTIEVEEMSPTTIVSASYF